MKRVTEVFDKDALFFFFKAASSYFTRKQWGKKEEEEEKRNDLCRLKRLVDMAIQMGNAHRLRYFYFLIVYV